MADTSLGDVCRPWNFREALSAAPQVIFLKMKICTPSCLAQLHEHLGQRVSRVTSTAPTTYVPTSHG